MMHLHRPGSSIRFAQRAVFIVMMFFAWHVVGNSFGGLLKWDIVKETKLTNDTNILLEYDSILEKRLILLYD